MILHFMENYTFVVQDVVKSLNWNNAKATIHPLVIHVIHFKKYDKLEHKSSLCVSDHKQHDVFSVYACQATLINELAKFEMPQISKIIYFSDGCSGKYILQTCFVANLAFIHLLNGIFWNLSWKNVCDQIGGSIKRLAA